MTDWLDNRRIRQRDPLHLLYDSEVLTIEAVCEFLGINTDLQLFTLFLRYYGDWFRKLVSHLIAIVFCQRLGLSPLRFSELLNMNEIL